MQRRVDNYVGRLGIAVLRPVAMILGAVLRRNHELTVGAEVVWMKLLGGGSLLIAMPMLLGFRRAHPNVKMVLITTPSVKPFAELMGVFDEYRIIDNRGPLRILASAFRTLVRTLRADCIVDLEVHSRLTTIFTTLTMARNRVSFWLEDIFWRRGLASHLVFFNRASGSYHFYDRIGDAFGTPVASRENCRAALLGACKSEFSITPAPGQVCVGFACSELGQERMLTPAQWRDVFRANVRPELRAFRFLGGRADRDRAQAIIDTVAPDWPAVTFVNDCGDRSLQGSVGVLFDSTEFWGIDSGLLHLARIVGLRCVSYWGPTDPATRLRESWAIDEQVHYRKIACSPCVHTSQEPPCRGDNRCIRGLFDGPADSPLNWTPLERPPMRTRSAPPGRSVLATLWHHIGFVTVAVVLLYTLVHAFDPPRLNWGDSYSDYNVMTAGRNFQKYGFVRLRFTPVLLDADLVTAADRRLIYTHYPQLPDVMNGVYRTAFGLSTLSQFRLVALAFSFTSLFFVYQLVAAYWSRRTAQIALALWVLNPLWIQHADYLHHWPYASFFGFGSVYLLQQYLRRQRWPWLVASGACLFLLFLASYDYWIFVPLLLAMVAVAHEGRVSARALGV